MGLAPELGQLVRQPKSSEAPALEARRAWRWGYRAARHDQLSGCATWSAPAPAHQVPGGAAYTDGHCDWRLPTEEELLSFVDATAPGCGSGSPCIPPALGPTCASPSWSSTTRAGVLFQAWTVNFFIGRASTDTKINPLLVGAVRGGS